MVLDGSEMKVVIVIWMEKCGEELCDIERSKRAESEQIVKSVHVMGSPLHQAW